MTPWWLLSFAMKISKKLKHIFGPSAKDAKGLEATHRSVGATSPPNRNGSAHACPRRHSDGPRPREGPGESSSTRPTLVPSVISCVGPPSDIPAGGLDPSAHSRRRASTSSSAEPATAASYHAISATNVQGSLKPSGKCPFLHGTVYADPYPGYAHGNPKRGICPRGCRPQLTSDVTAMEGPKETLLREAMEYVELYYHERGEEMRGEEGFVTKAARIRDIKRSVDATGTYEQTFDEIQHGARVAWRNAPKCSNRKHWQQLKLLDCREVASNKGMYDSCIQHLTKAVSESRGAHDMHIKCE